MDEVGDVNRARMWLESSEDSMLKESGIYTRDDNEDWNRVDAIHARYHRSLTPQRQDWRWGASDTGAFGMTSSLKGH